MTTATTKQQHKPSNNHFIAGDESANNYKKIVQLKRISSTQWSRSPNRGQIKRMKSRVNSQTKGPNREGTKRNKPRAYSKTSSSDLKELKHDFKWTRSIRCFNSSELLYLPPFFKGTIVQFFSDDPLLLCAKDANWGLRRNRAWGGDTSSTRWYPYKCV